VAIVMSYETRWAIAAGLEDRAWDVVPEAAQIHKTLVDKNVPTDAMDPREDLSSYRLVIAPRLFCVDAAIAANLERFVREGGVLCLTAASGVVDEFNKSFDLPRPGPLAEMAGIEVSDLSPLHAPVALRSAAIPGLEGKTCTTLADEIHLGTARAVAEFDGGWRKGRPAITLNAYGQGQVVYVGAMLDEAAMGALVDDLCQLAGVRPLVDTPPGVRVYQRRGPGTRLWFVLNYTGAAQTISLPGTWRDVFTGEACQAVEVAPVDVRILAEA
jgi:beta-galactosidase